MLDLQEIYILAQLLDNVDICTGKLEKAYSDNDGETFAKSRGEILGIKNKISKMIK